MLSSRAVRLRRDERSGAAPWVAGVMFRRGRSRGRACVRRRSRTGGCEGAWARVGGAPARMGRGAALGWPWHSAEHSVEGLRSDCSVRGRVSLRGACAVSALARALAWSPGRGSAEGGA
eukprot:5908313-Prymnesium_polylepis.1